jgi:LPXTG-motif cell wall-anchored protein
MKKFFVALMAVMLLVLGSAGAAHAQSAGRTVTGKVIRWDGTPVPNATVRALRGQWEDTQEVARTTADADGNYTLNLPDGDPYWIHVDTIGTWWGYSYKPAMALQPGEVMSQVYFAVGPRDVKEVVLPTAVSNLAPAESTPAPEVAAPVSDAKPLVGGNDNAAQTTSKPVSQVKPLVGGNKIAAAPQKLPSTGLAEETWGLALAAALGILIAGFSVRRVALRRS